MVSWPAARHVIIVSTISSSVKASERMVKVKMSSSAAGAAIFPVVPSRCYCRRFASSRDWQYALITVEARFISSLRSLM